MGALCSLHAPTSKSSGQQTSARSKPLGQRQNDKSHFPPSLVLQQQLFLSHSKWALKHSFNFQYKASSSLLYDYDIQGDKSNKAFSTQPLSLTPIMSELDIL